MLKHKKGYLKTNYNKIIIFCLIMFFSVGLLFSFNALKEVKAYYPSNPQKANLSLNNDILTPSGTAISNPTATTFYFCRVYYGITNEHFSDNGKLKAEYSISEEILETFEGNEIKAINLNDYSWSQNVVYTLYLRGEWGGETAFLSNLVYYVRGETVNNLPISTNGYSYKLSDSTHPTYDIAINGTKVTVSSLLGVTGHLDISYFSGADNTFKAISIMYIKDSDNEVSFDLGYLPLSEYTAYRVSLEFYDINLGFSGTASEWIYSISPMLPLPTAPEKEGHTFIGWYYDEEYTQPYIVGTPIFENTNLYAKYEINTYTVTFNSNGGEIVDGNTTQIIEYGKSAVAPTVSRTGYRFIGWDKSYDNITGDLIVNAQWERITYIVTFYVDGEIYDTIEVDYGTMFFDNSSVQKIMQTLSAVYLDAEKTVSLSSTTVLSEDTVLYADVNASLRNWLDFALWFQKNWIWLAVGAGVLALIIIVVIIKVKRG